MLHWWYVSEANLLLRTIKYYPIPSGAVNTQLFVSVDVFMRHMKNVFIHLFISIYRLSAVGKYLYERSAFCASCQFELLTAQPSRIVQSLPMKSRKTVSSIGDVFDTAATEYRLLGTNWQRSRCRVFAKYQRRFVSDQQAQTSSENLACCATLGGNTDKLQTRTKAMPMDAIIKVA